VRPTTGSERRGWARGGWDYVSKEREVRVGARDGQEWEANITEWGACGEMAAAANAEWGGQTAHEAVKRAMSE